MKFPSKIETPAGEIITLSDGDRAEGDKRIYTQFPRQPWPTTLRYIASILRLKGMVEDNNYPNGKGAGFLSAFINEAILRREVTMAELCRKYNIPAREG